MRGAALTALVALDPKRGVPTLTGVLNDAGNSSGVREKSVQLLSGINLPEAQEPLVQALPAAPSRLQIHIAVGLAGSAAGAEKLLEAVGAGKASARLLQERFVELRLAGLNLAQLNERVAKLTQGLPPADQARLWAQISQARSAHVLRAYVAHMALRMSSWSAVHHEAAVTDGWNGLSNG